MKKPPLALSIIIFLYTLCSLVALYRAVSTQAFDLFSLGVIPVVIGLIIRASWASIIFKVYLAIQALGLSALAGTAIIAYQISPDEVKVTLGGQDIPVPLIAVIAVLLLTFQIWVAFSNSTKSYLAKESVD